MNDQRLRIYLDDIGNRAVRVLRHAARGGTEGNKEAEQEMTMPRLMRRRKWRDTPCGQRRRS